MEIVGGFILKIVFCKTGAFTDKLAPAKLSPAAASG
jgi:hypothetical protein